MQLAWDIRATNLCLESDLFGFPYCVQLLDPLLLDDIMVMEISKALVIHVLN